MDVESLSKILGFTVMIAGWIGCDRGPESRDVTSALSVRASNTSKYHEAPRSWENFYARHDGTFLRCADRKRNSILLFVIGAFRDTRLEGVALGFLHPARLGPGFRSRMSLDGLFSTFFCKIGRDRRLGTGRICGHGKK